MRNLKNLTSSQLAKEVGKACFIVDIFYKFFWVDGLASLLL